MRIIKAEKVYFKDRLRELMKRDHISQEKLAEKMGISKNTVTSWLKGVPLKRNRKDQLIKLGEIFNVDPGYIACEQAEERVGFANLENQIDTENLCRDVKMLEAMIKILDSINVKYSSTPINGTAERFDIVVDNVQYEIEDVVPSEYSVELSFNNRHVTLTDREFQDLCNTQIDYLMYQVEKLFKAKE